MRVSGMGQKENPAMPATAHIRSQAGFLSQQGAQDNVVLPHQFPDGRTATIPVRTELELLLDFNYQKPRDWLTMETLQYTPFVLPLWVTSVTRGKTKASLVSNLPDTTFPNLLLLHP